MKLNQVAAKEPPSPQPQPYVHPLLVSSSNLSLMWPELPSARLRVESCSTLSGSSPLLARGNFTNASHRSPIKQTLEKITVGLHSKDGSLGKFGIHSKENHAFYSFSSLKDLASLDGSSPNGDFDGSYYEDRDTQGPAENKNSGSIKFNTLSKSTVEIRPLNASNGDLTASGSLISIRGSFNPKQMLSARLLAKLSAGKVSSPIEDSHSQSPTSSNPLVSSSVSSPEAYATVTSASLGRPQKANSDFTNLDQLSSCSAYARDLPHLDITDLSHSAASTANTDASTSRSKENFNYLANGSNEVLLLSKARDQGFSSFELHLVTDNLSQVSENSAQQLQRPKVDLESTSAQETGEANHTPQLPLSPTAVIPAGDLPRPFHDVDRSGPTNPIPVPPVQNTENAVTAFPSNSPSGKKSPPCAEVSFGKTAFRAKAKILEEKLANNLVDNPTVTSNADLECASADYTETSALVDGSNHTAAAAKVDERTDSSFKNQRIHIYGFMPADFYKRKKIGVGDQRSNLSSDSNVKSVARPNEKALGGLQGPPPPPAPEALKKLAKALAETKKRVPIPTGTANGAQADEHKQHRPLSVTQSKKSCNGTARRSSNGPNSSTYASVVAGDSNATVNRPAHVEQPSAASPGSTVNHEQSSKGTAGTRVGGKLGFGQAETSARPKSYASAASLNLGASSATASSERARGSSVQLRNSVLADFRRASRVSTCSVSSNLTDDNEKRLTSASVKLTGQLKTGVERSHDLHATAKPTLKQRNRSNSSCKRQISASQLLKLQTGCDLLLNQTVPLNPPSEERPSYAKVKSIKGKKNLTNIIQSAQRSQQQTSTAVGKRHHFESVTSADTNNAGTQAEKVLSLMPSTPVGYNSARLQPAVGPTSEDYQVYLSQATQYVTSLKASQLALLQLQIQGQQLMSSQQLQAAEANLPPQAYLTVYQQQETLHSYYQNWKTYFEQLDATQLQTVVEQFGQYLASFACQSAAAAAIAANPLSETQKYAQSPQNSVASSNSTAGNRIAALNQANTTADPINSPNSANDFDVAPNQMLSSSPFGSGATASYSVREHSEPVGRILATNTSALSSPMNTVRAQALRHNQSTFSSNWLGKAANSALTAISAFSGGGSSTHGNAFGITPSGTIRSVVPTRTYSTVAGSPVVTSVFTSGKDTISRTEGRAFGYQQVMFRRENGKEESVGNAGYLGGPFLASQDSSEQLSASVLHNFLKKLAGASVVKPEPLASENAANLEPAPKEGKDRNSKTATGIGEQLAAIRGDSEAKSGSQHSAIESQVSIGKDSERAAIASNGAECFASKKLNIFLPAFLKLEFSKDLRLGKKLAEGGGGVVYQCEVLDQDFIRNRSLTSGYRFVFKSVSKTFNSDSKNAHKLNAECFYQEVSLMYALRGHPNCIRLIAWTDAPDYGMLMKQYDMDLTTLIVRRKNEPLPFWRLSTDVARALKDLHYYNITHNDVKSSNIFIELIVLKSDKASPNNTAVSIPTPPSCIIERNGRKFHYRAVLADFGLAYYWGNDGVKGRQKMLTFGLSLPYAGPELLAAQYMGSDARQKIIRKEFTSKLDAYAFSVILWEMLERSRAWSGVPSGQIQTYVIQGKRPDISSHKRNHPVVKLIEMGWNDAADERPDMETMYRELEALAHQVSSLHDTT